MFNHMNLESIVSQFMGFAGLFNAAKQRRRIEPGI